MNIIYRIVTRGEVSWRAANAALKVQRVHPDWDVLAHPCRISVDMARCECIVEARDLEADYLIMVDDDVEINGSVEQLIGRDLPVVAGPVMTWKHGGFFYNIYHLDREGIYYSVSVVPGTISSVYAVGAAVLCIRKDVIQNSLLDPMFEIDRDSRGMLAPLGGEDVMFCRKLHAHDIPVHVDPSVWGEHIAVVEMRKTAEKHNRVFSINFNTKAAMIDLPVSESYRKAQERSA